MNPEPHTHGVEIAPPDNEGDIKVTYGDHHRYVYSRHTHNPRRFEKRLKKVVRKLVRDHDKGTIRRAEQERLVKFGTSARMAEYARSVSTFAPPKEQALPTARPVPGLPYVDTEPTQLLDATVREKNPVGAEVGYWARWGDKGLVFDRLVPFDDRTRAGL
jgi:hypothetical protein